MINKISKIFETSLSMSSRIQLTEWLIDEFGSIYKANKILEDYNDLKDFVLDMIEQSGNDHIIKEIEPTRFYEYKFYTKGKYND